MNVCLKNQFVLKEKNKKLRDNIVKKIIINIITYFYKYILYHFLLKTNF